MCRRLVTIPHPFLSCNSPASEVICTTEERRDTAMDKDSVMYQLMDLRVNTVLNSILEADEDYQEIRRKSDVYSGQLDAMGLPEGTRLLIDRYVSEQNALGARYGALAYLLGFSDCIEMFRYTLQVPEWGNINPAG